MLLVLGFGTHRHDHLTDVHTGHGALGFSKSTAHSSLEPEEHSTKENVTKWSIKSSGFPFVKSLLVNEYAQRNKGLPNHPVRLLIIQRKALAYKQVADSHLSAPAQDNILLMRMTWKGCRRMRMWKPSLPQVFTMYLLAQIRAASRATKGEEELRRVESFLLVLQFLEGTISLVFTQTKSFFSKQTHYRWTSLRKNILSWYHLYSKRLTNTPPMYAFKTH